MDITSFVEKFKSENNRLWTKIGEVIDTKAGKWDRGVEGQNPELTQMLIYEYATSLEAITHGKLTAEFVVDKLSRTLGTFRLGDFREGQDDNIKYDNNPVTSEAYKKECRIDGHFGAHQVDYEEDGKHLFSVAMFDRTQKYQTSDGQEHTLSGGNLESLDDIRQTVFHEWTHVMEKCLVKASELTRNDIIQTRGNSTYINTCISPDWTMEQYKEYIANVDQMLKAEEEILFGGISTIEINEKKSPNKRIMHNQISEGATELISKKIMQHLGRPIDNRRYKEQADFVEKVFDSLGMDTGIATYLTSSNKIISYIESKNHDGKDVLRDSDSFITALGNFENALKGMTKNAGNEFKENFDNIKAKMKGFWRQGRSPSEKDIEEFFSEIDGFAKVPQDQNSYVKNMINFALTYPKRDKEFREELDSLFPPAKGLTEEDVIEAVKNNPEVTEKSIQEASREIIDIASRPQSQITAEQRIAIEEATRKCIARMGEGKISEEQIQGLLTKMYGMKDVKEAMDSLTMNVSKVFGKPEFKPQLAESIQDIMHIDPSVYKSSQELLAQLQRNIETNYTPGNISIEENHALINKTLKSTCDKLNELGVDYYVVGALSTFIKTGTPLFRYHGDLDFMVAEADLPKVQQALAESDYNFSDDRLDNKKTYTKGVGHTQGEHEVIANHKENEFHLGFFLFRREQDESITVREYFMEEENGVKKPKILERHIPAELARLEYSEELTEYAGTSFRTSTPESVFAKKTYTQHPKDILDIKALEGKIDYEKIEKMGEYISPTDIVDIDEVSKNIPKKKSSQEFPDFDD